MKDFFKINEPYKFEWNDLRAFITVINVIPAVRVHTDAHSVRAQEPGVTSSSAQSEQAG